MADEMVHKGPRPVTAYEGYAIYADYDANAPNSEDVVFVSTEELAKEVCGKLNEDPRSYGNLAFVDGWEFCKSFRYHTIVLKDESDFARTLSAAMTWDGDGDGDGDDEEGASED